MIPLTRLSLPVNHGDLCAVEKQSGSVTDQEDSDGADQHGRQILLSGYSLAGPDRPAVSKTAKYL